MRIGGNYFCSRKDCALVVLFLQLAGFRPPKPQVTISYVSQEFLEQAAQARRLHLANYWGFHCGCERCDPSPS